MQSQLVSLPVDLENAAGSAKWGEKGPEWMKIYTERLEIKHLLQPMLFTLYLMEWIVTGIGTIEVVGKFKEMLNTAHPSTGLGNLMSTAFSARQCKMLL